MGRAAFALSVLAGLGGAAGGCQRATLGGRPDAGGVPLDDSGAAADVSSALDLGVGGIGDGSSSDAVTFVLVRVTTCPTAPAPAPCPVDRPAAGSACAAAGTVCEYGGANLACRDLLLCAPDLTWRPQRSACAAASADACPAAMPELGSACVAQVGCSYSAQVLCFCSLAAMQWSCVSVPVDPSCPGEVPLYGAPCDRAGQDCLYGFNCGGYETLCCNGAWLTGPGPCSE